MRKVVVIGGSAGGIEALGAVLQGLPADFPSPVLAVIHIGESVNMLPLVLQHYTKLRVVSPETPLPLVAGQVYVPPSNKHLVVRDGCALGVPGPRENRHRPAIDALFRSAARVYRSDVIAVVLSGALDDGSAGSLAVQVRGGVVIVQDPIEAKSPEMPTNVMKQVPVKPEYCLGVEKIAATLRRLASNGDPIAQDSAALVRCANLTVDEFLPVAEPVAYTCPDCGGSLWKVDDGPLEQFRCNVGHVYTLDSFSIAHSHALERALWMALQRLNEQRSIQEHLATRTTDPTLQRRYHENAAAAAEDMRLLKEILARL